jgi:predicted neuraminidase
MNITNREFLNVVTPTCHASTSVFYKGEPVYAWFGGSREGEPDSTIFIQFGDKGQCYTIGSDKVMARWNPILFTYEDRLYIFVKAGDFCDRWQTLLYDITNISEGQIPMMYVPAGLNGPVKTKPIIDEKTGYIYCGSSVETRYDWTSYIEVFSFNNEDFKYEHRTKPLVAPKVTYKSGYGGRVRMSNGIIQPSLWVDKDRIIHAFFRSSTGLNKLYYAMAKLPSEKNTLHRFDWSTPMPIEHLDNPNSGVDTVYMNGRLFLVYNPDPVRRNPLSLAELDEKLNIIDSMVITEETEGQTYTGELSYPYMVEDDGKLHITYTYGRSQIEHVTVEV